jgi:molybdate transport system ATP-binding protein
LNEANLLADHLCLLHHGVSLQSGTPEAVSVSPVSTQVAKLMDQPNIFTATIVSHPAEKMTLLSWQGQLIEARYQAKYKQNEKICWMIPATDVILHRRQKKSKGERENPFSGTITHYMLLGGYVTILMCLNQPIKTTLTLSIPLHVARRNALKVGVTIGVSLLAESIHIMPFESLSSKG